jgi:hypothetical protein
MPTISRPHFADHFLLLAHTEIKSRIPAREGKRNPARTGPARAKMLTKE